MYAALGAPMMLRRGVHLHSQSVENALNFHARHITSHSRCSPIPAHVRFLHAATILGEQSARPGHDQTSTEKPTQPPQPVKRKIVRKPATQSSLRKVAVDAERSRAGLKHGFGHDQETKDVTAYCVAETYRLDKVAQILAAAGHRLDPCNTGLYPQVIHFQVAAPPSSHDGPSPRAGDVFIFPTGTAVAWDVDPAWIHQLISTTLLPAAEGSHPERLETEDLDYVEDSTSEKSSITGDTIHIGMKSRPSSTSTGDTTGSSSAAPPTHDTNLALARIAFSSGLARSTKLAVLESLLDGYFASTASMPLLLSSGTRLPYSRAFILRKTGELLAVRAALNLSSELTDSLPDLFWNAAPSLGLEALFDMVQRALDVRVRVKILNDRLDYAQEIAAVLRETLGERHGFRLEWAIIVLIVVEVGFEGWRSYGELRERRSAEGTEALLKRWLRKQLRDEGKGA